MRASSEARLVRGTGLDAAPPTLERLCLSLRVNVPAGGAHVAKRKLQLLHTEIADKRFDEVLWGKRRSDDGGEEIFLASLLSRDGWQWSDRVYVYLFCATLEGISVSIRVEGFQPYLLYVVDSHTQGRGIVSELESRLCWRRGPDEPVVKFAFEFDRRRQFFNYVPSESNPREAKQDLLLRVFFPSLRLWRQASKLDLPARHPVGTSVQPSAQFHERSCIRPCGWFTAVATTPPVRLLNGVSRWSCDDLQCATAFAHLRPVAESDPIYAAIADVAIMAFDIEVVSSCYSADGSRKFPNAKEKDDEVISIQVVLSRLNTGVLHRLCLYNTRGEMERLPTPLEACDVFYYETEKALLDAYSDLVVYFNPLIIAGHNTLKFDHPFVCARTANPLVDEVSTCALFVARFLALRCAMREVISESKQRGKRVKCSPGWVGRLDLDTCEYVVLNYSLSSNTLNNAALELLPGQQAKVDLTPQELFAAADSRDPERVRQILEYGIVDSDLVDKLLRELKAVVAMFADAVVHNTLFDTLAFRGATAKAKNFLTDYAQQEGYYMNSIPPELNNVDEFEGATVFPPKPGLYYWKHNDYFVCTWDFASLYPSLIRAFGICYSTYLLPGQEVPPECEVQSFEVAPGRVHRFVKCCDGIVPAAVAKLVEGRNDAKRKMKEASTAEERAVWDAVQKARKVGCNSLYGNFGANGKIDPETGERVGAGPLPLVPAAEVITYLGRMAIQRAAALCIAELEKRGVRAEIIYGDTDSCFAACRYSDISSIKTSVAVESDGRVRFRVTAKKASEKCIAIDTMMTDVGKAVSAIIGEGTKVTPKLEFEKSFGCPLDDEGDGGGGEGGEGGEGDEGGGGGGEGGGGGGDGEGGFILITKKRYAGMLREPFSLKAVLKLQGLEAKRRDQPLTSRRMMVECLPLLLRGQDGAAADLIEERIRQMEMDELPLEDYVISKTLSKDPFAGPNNGGYALPELMEVVHVARKHVERGGVGAAPSLNDRVRFVLTHNPCEPRVAARADCPTFVAGTGGRVKVDRVKYIERGRGVIGRIFLQCEWPDTFARIEKSFLSGAARALNRLSGIAAVSRRASASAGGSGSADGGEGRVDADAAPSGARRSRDELFEGLENCAAPPKRRRFRAGRR